MTKEEHRITDYMYNTGNYLVAGVGAYYWANNNHKGCLIEAASSADIAIVQKLAREGRGGMLLETKTMPHDNRHSICRYRLLE